MSLACANTGLKSAWTFVTAIYILVLFLSTAQLHSLPSNKHETSNVRGATSSTSTSFTPFTNLMEGCNLEEPHTFFDLSRISDPTPPTVQSVWIGYYSHVIVAEHQPLQLSIQQLFCAALAAKKILSNLDSAKYGKFDQEISQTLEEVGLSGEEGVKDLIRSGGGVDELMLHPDLFDEDVVKALITLGWEEMKFYGSLQPIWWEWLEDQQDDILEWIQQVSEEVVEVEEEMEKLSNEQVRIQLKGTQVSLQEEMKRNKSSGIVDGATSKNQYRKKWNLMRLEETAEHFQIIWEQLDRKRQDLVSEKRELEIDYEFWRKQREVVFAKWVQFRKGAEERLMRSSGGSTNSSGGQETWEEGLKHIEMLFYTDREGNRHRCEGYLLEMVIGRNKEANMTGGNQFNWHNQTNQLQSDFQIDDNDNSEVDELDDNLNDMESSTMISMLNELLQETMQSDWMTDEFIDALNGMDINIDKVLDTVLNFNPQHLDVPEGLNAVLLEDLFGMEAVEIFNSMLGGASAILNEVVESDERTKQSIMGGRSKVSNNLGGDVLGGNVADELKKQSRLKNEREDDNITNVALI